MGLERSLELLHMAAAGGGGRAGAFRGETGPALPPPADARAEQDLSSASVLALHLS